MHLLISGAVIQGLGEGKKIGFPTLNISVKKIPKKMRKGVYAARVKMETGNFCGVVYYGPRFGHKDSSVCEVHIFGLERSFRGRGRVVLDLFARIRGVKKFSTIHALRRAIRRDIEQAILVSGFISPMPHAANALLKKRYDWKAIRRHAARIIVMNSDNDPWGFNETHGKKIAARTHGKFILCVGQGHMGSATYHQPYRQFPLLKKFL